MHDFRTVQTTTIVGGGKQFSNSKSHIREENYDDSRQQPRHVAMLVAIGMMVVIAFSLATCGALSVSSTAESIRLTRPPIAATVLVAVAMMVMIAFRCTADGTFSVTSTIELKLIAPRRKQAVGDTTRTTGNRQ